jgi:hypothetical protein
VCACVYARTQIIDAFMMIIDHHTKATMAAPRESHLALALLATSSVAILLLLRRKNAAATSKQNVLEARAQCSGPSVALSYRADPLMVVDGKGAWLFDEQGRGYLDCVNNVAHVGHSHPKVPRCASLMHQSCARRLRPRRDPQRRSWALWCALQNAVSLVSSLLPVCLAVRNVPAAVDLQQF